MALDTPSVHAVTNLGSRVLVWFQYLDQNGSPVIHGPLKFPAGHDLNAEAVSQLPEVRRIARQFEINRALKDVNAGADSLAVYQRAYLHVQPEHVARQMLLEAMQEEDPGSMLRVQSLMTHLNATYPGPALASYLGVPGPRVVALRNRYAAAIAADLATLRATDQWQ